MQRHFDDDLDKLKSKIACMGEMVEKAIGDATSALLEGDADKALTVKKGDHDIDMLEIDIDNLAHELIALNQPAAVDLRFITMSMKVTHDLERMGDHASNIASRAISLAKEKETLLHKVLPDLVKATRHMVGQAVQAFIQGDVKLAQDVLDADDVVDDYYDQIYQETRSLLDTGNSSASVGLHMVMIGNNLERIADLATNIAEDEIFAKQGREIRHHHTNDN